ncbi:conserved hypothetical protein [Candidatus Sulfopaludibacter sp. SbA6]|nr:conserved hypothetical protein [Candidatus Sulfopaludibacter sp. SbA6]
MKRLLIEEWLPIAALGEESMRERRSMTALPPTYYLHVWFARRPLVASRAAILGSLLPADADREKFLHVLGIHGDPIAGKIRIAKATEDGVRLGADAYGYPRAFSYTPTADELAWVRAYSGDSVLLDPTAGGGSIPFEAVRLGFSVVANDLNAVAALILKATVDLPLRFGPALLARNVELGNRFSERVRGRVVGLYPEEPRGWTCDGYLWARTIVCPYCAGLVPLSPSWALDSEGTGVRIAPNAATRRCGFEIVKSSRDQSKGTVKDGIAECPFPDCGRVIDGDEVKAQAQAGNMGQQLYAVVYKYDREIGHTKAGEAKIKRERGFRAPRPEDEIETLVAQKLRDKMPEWKARDIVPDEEIPFGYETMVRWPLDRYGLRRWAQMFSARQLYAHCVSVEVFQEIVSELRDAQGWLNDLDRAALTYVAISLDKMLNYNCRTVRWIPQRGVMAGQFDTHDFSFKWSFAELAPTVPGIGYDWAIRQTAKALGEIIKLLGHSNQPTFDRPTPPGSINVSCGSADRLELAAASVDCIVMDPPYHKNVMYAELSDFFYVWLKRTAGILYPELFSDPLTNKDREAVANPARFAGQKGASDLAGADYEERMAAIFSECRRVLKPDGAMTVMFTHKATGAWDALAGGLIKAGFIITASWPVNSEAEGSLHIQDKAAARSTIFLVCRAREESKPNSDDVTHWEDVEPKVAAAVRKRVAEFQEAGIRGVDLYLASFGPALQVFSEFWPLKRGRARQEQPGRQKRLFDKRDPYEVRAEDALEAARREVKNWRMQQLASLQRQHQMDPLTEWFVLAWDAFRAPRFPSDEAIKLARVVGLDFEKQVKNVVCEIKGDDVVLWDSKERKARGKLTQAGGGCMLDVLHFAAAAAREHRSTEVGKAAVERANLLGDPNLMVALQALLNVLPPPAAPSKKGESRASGAAADFAALELLRRLAFAKDVPPPPDLPEQFSLALEEE